MPEQRNEPVDARAEHDQDAEPTMTAPPEVRPDGGASASGRDDSPDAVDADQADAEEPPPPAVTN
ncbi:hypothetical protein [Pseudonocardia hierapolitana]|uniref:hypothetical protein n=1 Tax=Pseudonocardia hierapolitana TaxID=1128676 RepID=UPI0011BD99F3|nr:hypothetical protein [Pseudonocardia hierapolitana]